MDGLILVGNTHEPALFGLLAQAGVPAVQTFGTYAQATLPSIGFDDAGPSYEITEYLLQLSHRELALLCSYCSSNDRLAARREGMLRCLRDHGLEAACDAEVGYTIAEGRRGLGVLLETGRPFTAVLTTGDVLAAGVVIEARRRGVKVPDALSVTGFHDHDLAAQLDPPLTTVHAPVREMCEAAADYLLGAIEGEAPSLPPPLPTCLVIRQSTGPRSLSGTG